jgi:hypothetical protein
VKGPIGIGGAATDILTRQAGKCCIVDGEKKVPDTKDIQRLSYQRPQSCKIIRHTVQLFEEMILLKFSWRQFFRGKVVDKIPHRKVGFP